MNLLLWILVVFAPLIVFAQVVPGLSPVSSPIPLPIIPVALPTPSNDPGLVSTVSGLISFARGWQSLGFYAATATALKLIVDASKLSFLGAPFEKIPEKFRLLVLTGIGTIIATLGFGAAGAAPVAAIMAGFGSAVGSSFVHELVKDFFPGDAQKPGA